MDSTTALNAANYKVYKVPTTYTTLAGDTEFYDGASIVAIKLDKDLYAAAQAAITLIVSSVKDLAGNVIADNANSAAIAATNTLEDALALKTVTTNGVVATGLRTIVLTFNQEIESCDEDGISVTNVGSTTYSKSIEINGNKVTATFAADIASFDSATITATAGYKKGKIHGRLGDPSADESTLTITDKIAPSIVSIAKKDADKITIKFNKALKQMTAAVDNQIANDIKVYAKDNADSDYRLLDPFVKAEISFGEIADGGKILDVTINTAKVQLDSPFKVVVKDAEYVVSKTAGTPVADQEFVSADNDGDAEAFDFKAPVVTEVKTTGHVDATHYLVTVTFDEALNPATVAVEGFQFNSAAVEAATYNEAEKTVVLKVTKTNYEADQKLVVKNTVKDLAGNAYIELVKNWKVNIGTTNLEDNETSWADDVWAIEE